MKPKKPLPERVVDAEVRASSWLGDANDAQDRGDLAGEERCLAKAQFWLDRANLLSSLTERKGPKA